MSPLPSTRTATGADAVAVARFLRENFIVAYGHCSTPENIRRHVATTYPDERIAAEIDSPDFLTLLAVAASGTIAGVSQLAFATATPPCAGANAVELRRFYLAPEWHGKGLADALMQRTVAIATARGDALWLSAWEEAPRALGFYRRAGFAAAGTTTFVVGDDAKTDLVMLRRLR